MICVLICTFSFLISHELLIYEENKAKRLEFFADATERIIVMLRFGQYDVYEICETVFSGDINGCNFIRSNGSFNEQWEEFCQSETLCGGSDMAHVERIGEILGSSDCESQIERLAYIREELLDSYSKKRSEIDRNRKIYLSLGCFVGIMVCILMI